MFFGGKNYLYPALSGKVMPIKLFVAVPCYGGILYNECLLGLLSLQSLCLQKGISIKVFALGNESLITRARNICVSAFLDDPDDYTHLLFIDADIGFRAENVLRLLEYDQEICCGVYGKKDINWEEVLKGAKEQGMTAERLQAMSLLYNVRFPDPHHVRPDRGFVETADGATGFMLIKRQVFEKMKEAYAELKYKSDHWVNSQRLQSENTYLFFDCIKDEDGRYLSEDYTFCKRWRTIGGKIYSDITMPLTHIGAYSFDGNVADKFEVQE